MENIKFELYKDHEWISLIQESIQEARNKQTEIPQHCLDIWGMSGMKYRMLINNLMRKLPNPRYLEIGTYTGSTLCAAIGGVTGMKALAVDNFSLGGSSIDQCRANVDKVKAADSDIVILNQSFEEFDFSAYGKFNVYMYDAEHDEEDQKAAITRCHPALDEYAVIIVDDWNDHGYTTPVKIGTYAGFAESKLEILFKWEVETGMNGPIGSDWHNGYAIFLVKNCS